MILPSLKEASTDRRLHGAEIRVLTYLHGTLEVGLYEVVKVWTVAESIGMDKAHVGRAIQNLLNCGYIIEGEKTTRGVRTFTIRANPPHKSAA